MSYKDVANNPDRPMGHAFVLAMMLEKAAEKAAEKCSTDVTLGESVRRPTIWRSPEED